MSKVNWYLEDNFLGFIQVRDQATDEVIVELEKETNADTVAYGRARLIAAAPELLNWAKAYLLLLEGMQVNHSINKGEQFFAHTTLSKLINELSRTIAEAEGRD